MKRILKKCQIWLCIILLIFGGLGQTLTIRHDSIDRTSFMPGVVLACKKIIGLNAGLTCNLDNIMD